MKQTEVEKIAPEIARRLVDSWEIRCLREKLFKYRAEEVSDVELLVDRKQLPGLTCLEYIFLDHPDPLQTLNDLIRNGMLVESPTDGDLICYFDDDGFWTHIGRVSSDGSIISKWGKRDVFKHRLESVPANYGDRYLYLRQVSSDLERH